MEDITTKQAIDYIKKNKAKIKKHFAGDQICKAEKNPVSVFMAGSTGAGKTEFSKNLMKEAKIKAVRIDADEIKELIPQYTGKNATEVQGASALGVEYLFDYALAKKKSLILDGTFSSYEKARSNIERSLKKGRFISIFYVHQDPLVAWEFTKAREVKEGRKVPKKVFIKSYFKSRENVNKIKKEFGKDVILAVIVRNFKNDFDKGYLDVQSVDDFLNIKYNPNSLLAAL